MKRIVVLCDGTWNSPDMTDTTHVHQLSQMLDRSDAQIFEYFTGVGVNQPREQGGFFVGRGLNKILGGATGFGLGKKVKEAYTYIARNYEAGDEIYLFGFSRGAYTARSVAGMIRKAGIVANPSAGNVRKAFRLYRKRGDRNHPDKDHIQRKRAQLSPHFATSEADQRARRGSVPLVKIAYVGVWDTVGQRGIPEQLLGPLAAVWNGLYAFHDTALSSLVQRARHAVAVDERRAFYQPARWENLATLNQRAGGTRYEQTWFVGDHGVVGGSAGTDAVSCFTLKWVVEGAPAISLKPDHTLAHPEANILAALDHLDNPKLFYKVASDLLKWRSGISSEADTHASVRERVEGRSDYSPKSLGALLAQWRS